MKKILFVMPKFAPGGAEKSLLMLMHLLKERKDIRVDLMLFKKEGIFLEQIPEEINVINTEDTLRVAYSKFNIKNVKNIRTFCISIVRPICTVLSSFFSKNYNQRNQIRWRFFYRHLLKMLPEEYDIACGYLDGESVYYIVDKVKAKKKYGWNQNDYKSIGANPQIDSIYYNKLDSIITLSDECHSILKDSFCECEDKMKLIPPIVTVDYIKKSAEEFIPEEYEKDKNHIIFVSVGRLVEQKGFDMAIVAASIMKKDGYKFHWYVIGNGDLKDYLQEQIVENKVEDCFHLIGEKGNPYPYVKNADIFVQPSRFEGKSVILNETKMLAKPIVVTEYPTVYDQIENNFNGIIVGMSSNDIAKGLENIIDSADIRQQLISNLSRGDFSDKKVEKDYLDLFYLTE